MRGNLPGPEGLARRGASAALHGLPVVTTTCGAARLASAPSPCQRGSRRILRQAPRSPALHRSIAGNDVPVARPTLDERLHDAIAHLIRRFDRRQTLLR